MSRLNWKLRKTARHLLDRLHYRWSYAKLCLRSLTYNAHMNASYASDVCMEPLIWVVDNYTHCLGPVFVVGVAVLTTAVVGIAYWIGLPFWWAKSPAATVVLFIIGHWLLLNVVFHYVMAVITPAGCPPEPMRSLSSAYAKRITLLYQIMLVYRKPSARMIFFIINSSMHDTFGACDCHFGMCFEFVGVKVILIWKIISDLKIDKKVMRSYCCFSFWEFAILWCSEWWNVAALIGCDQFVNKCLQYFTYFTGQDFIGNV